MKKQLMLVLASLAVAAGMVYAGEVKAVYDKDCAKCHGPDGKGQTKMGQKLSIKDFTDAKVQDGMKEEAMAKAIKEGIKDKDGKVTMKPIEGVAEVELKALVPYVRALKK